MGYDKFFYFCKKNMTYTQITELISEKSKVYRQESKRLQALNSELLQLRMQATQIETNSLIEFIGLNNKITIKRFVRFSGDQINIKNTPKINGNNVYQAIFIANDEIEIIKKNKCSIVIQCNKKIINKVETNPKSQFRVDFSQFKDHIMYDLEFVESFRKWLKRKEALDLLIK